MGKIVRNAAGAVLLIANLAASVPARAASAGNMGAGTTSFAYAMPDYVPAAAATPTRGIALPLGKCVNMGNMLESPTEGAWGRPILDSDAAKIAAAGFRTVRLPVRFSAHADTVPPYKIDPVFLARVQHVVGALSARDLNVIIDYHFDDALLASVSSNATRFTEIWRQIGMTFANAPSNIWFELLNEPNGNATDANLPALWQSAITAIRPSNPTRPIIVGGQNWSDINSLSTIQIPDDPNIVVTFHMYLPMAFTHQGAHWMNPIFPIGRHFGGQADADELAMSLRTTKAFMARTGRVPFLGEYGAIETIPAKERALYYKTISTAFASIGVQSCAWSYINTFSIATETSWQPGMLEAISATTTIR